MRFKSLILSIALLPGLSIAAGSQLSMFKKAEAALHQKDMSEYYSLKSKLQSDPLYPYLLYQEITSDFKEFKPSTIENVLSQYKGTYWDQLLRSKWLYYLGENQQWLLYVKAYQGGRSTTQKCWYWRAKYETGDRALALKNFTEIWLTGRSLPNSCNYMISEWEGSRYDTYDVRWQRIELAMDRGDVSLAEYLAKGLSSYDQRFVRAWVDAWAHPRENLTAFYTNFHDGGYFDFAYESIMLRYIGNDIEAATDYWLNAKYTSKLNIKVVDKIGGAIGVQLARDYDLKGLDWLTKAKYKTSLMWQWQARLAIRFSKWKIVLDTIEAMPKDLKDNSEWQYWLGRALRENGKAAEANQVFAQLAKWPDFYSYLAADEIGAPYALSSQMHKAPQSLITQMKQSEGIRQVHELIELGEYDLAINLWNFEMSQFSKEQRLAAAHIAAEWDIVYLSIRAYAWSGLGNENLPEYYPIVYGKEVEDIASKYGINPAWIWGLMRQESRFDPRAESYVGAMGLMQVMPDTAEFIAKRYKLHYEDPFSLYDPDTNIKVGIANADFIRNLFDGSYVLATASYNAGQGNVAKWLPNHVTMPASDWIETVPFSETRKYLRNVLGNLVVYETILLGNKKFRLSDVLTPVSPHS